MMGTKFSVMTRPQFPHRKFVGVYGLLLILAILVNRLLFDHDFLWYVYAAGLPMAVYMGYYAFRQHCTAYGLRVAIGYPLIGVAIMLIDRMGAGPNSSTEISTGQTVSLVLAGVLFMGKMVYDVIYLRAYIRRESYPERYAAMRKTFWSVRFSFDAGIVILLLVGLII